MATSPAKNFPNVCRFTAQALACGTLVCLLLASGCNREPTGGGMGTPTPVVSASAVPQGELSYDEILANYQAPVADDQNGWPLLKPLLVASEPDAPVLFDRLALLDLSNPADLSFFDQEVYPTLKLALSRPFFAEPHPLLSGRDPLMTQYRSLRTVCDLLGQRADLLWESGKKTEALEMVALPLSLAKAMQARLETVSVNLFSSGYATTSLGHIAEWAANGSLTEPELGKARELVAANRPSYQHLRSSLEVDFAQLEHSLGDEKTRTEVLGLGMARPEEITRWAEEVRGLHGEAQKLYAAEIVAPEAFNDAVMKRSSQVHGLVLDYPPMVEMQKRSYASYLATEIALALEAHRLAKTKAPAPDALLLEIFAGDSQAQQMVNALLLVQYPAEQVPERFLIAGQPGAFKVTAPDGVAFYQR